MFFGAGDRYNLTGRSIAAFLQLQRTEIEVDVVVVADSPHLGSIRQQVAGHKGMHLHVGLPTLAPLMAAADLAIGACGATSWERLCLGLPSLIVTLADNQRQVAACLHAEGMVHWIGDNADADQPAIARALAGMLCSAAFTEWSSRCLQACNGQGTQQVLQVLASMSEQCPDGSPTAVTSLYA